MNFSVGLIPHPLRSLAYQTETFVQRYSNCPTLYSGSMNIPETLFSDLSELSIQQSLIGTKLASNFLALLKLLIPYRCSDVE